MPFRKYTGGNTLSTPFGLIRQQTVAAVTLSVRYTRDRKTDRCNTCFVSKHDTIIIHLRLRCSGKSVPNGPSGVGTHAPPPDSVGVCRFILPHFCTNLFLLRLSRKRFRRCRFLNPDAEFHFSAVHCLSTSVRVRD